MKLPRISFLFLLFALLVQTAGYAQSSAGNSWNTFWTQFSSAVKSKNKAAIKRLMVSENNFMDGGGGETRDEWLARIDKGKLWSLLQKSVAKGTVAYNEGDFTGRITKDRHLIFQYTGGRWQFAGIMGD
jgi:hypothetical protein